MTLPNTTNAVTFPKGKFDGKFDEIVVHGEIYRAQTHINHLKNAEKDKLSVAVKLTKEDYLELKKHRAFVDRKVSGIKKVEVKIKKTDDDGEPIKDANGNFVFEMDDEDEPLKEFSHYQLSMSIGAYRKVEDEKVQRSLDIRVKKGIEYNDTDIIAEGSKIVIKGYLMDWEHPEQGKGCTIQPKVMVISELVKLESNYTDPLADMGIDMDELEAIEVPDFNKAEEVKQAPTKDPVEAPTQAQTEEFADEDPFAV